VSRKHKTAEHRLARSERGPWLTGQTRWNDTSCAPTETCSTRPWCRGHARGAVAYAAAAESLEVVGHYGEEECWLRYVLTHMIEEYARHNGPADLLRERLDGRAAAGRRMASATGKPRGLATPGAGFGWW